MGQFQLKQLYLELVNGPSKFLDQHPHPWVVLIAAAKPKEDFNLRTTVYNLDGHISDEVSPEVLADTPAFEVVKSAINAFGLGVTVGRTKNNDIPINDGRISRFHAYFRSQDGSWLLSDAGSKNGTKIDGQPVDSRRPRPLPERAWLDFGGYKARFFSPDAFVEFLRSAAPRRPSHPSRP